MNKYEKAIKSNEQKQFLLGRGEYFVRNRDYGTHDASNTVYYIFSYIKSSNEDFNQLDNDLCNILKDEFLSTFDLSQILNIIWSYFSKKAENDIQKTWNLSDELRLLIKLQIQKHKEISSEMNEIDWYIKMFLDKFNFSI